MRKTILEVLQSSCNCCVCYHCWFSVSLFITRLLNYRQDMI